MAKVGEFYTAIGKKNGGKNHTLHGRASGHFRKYLPTRVFRPRHRGWLFINANPRVPSPIHTNSMHARSLHQHRPRTVNGYDSIPSGTGGSVEAMEEGHRRRKCREEDVDWCESLGERRMTPNVRPDREIRHTSDAPLRYPPPCPRCQPAITFPGVVSTSVLYRLLTYALTIGKISIC